jgi:hypothetical protein
MLYRSLIGAIALVSALGVPVTDTRAWDDSRYPDLKGAPCVAGTAAALERPGTGTAVRFGRRDNPAAHSCLL